jgi:type II secretory ATPase GspE/PulE/Tfp pilus assembly ATPase PilB-like protein
MKRVAAADDHRFLLQDALEKVREGLTTVEEILRVVRTDPGDDIHSSARLSR